MHVSVGDASLNKQLQISSVVLFCAGGDNGAVPSTSSVEERYVRHVDSAASGANERVEYDMDDGDEAWLAKYNKQVLLSCCRSVPAMMLTHCCISIFKDLNTRYEVQSTSSRQSPDNAIVCLHHCYIITHMGSRRAYQVLQACRALLL